MSHRTRALGRTLATIGVVSALSTLGLAPPSFAIERGAPSTAKWLVAIQDGSNVWTGVAINESWILTVKHVSDVPSLTVSFADNPFGDPTQIPVDRVVDAAGGDNRLLHLASAHPLPSYPGVNLSYQWTRNQPGVIYGRGAPNSGTRQQADVTVIRKSFDAYAEPALRVAESTTGSPGMGRNGDTGGPLLIDGNVVGVASTISFDLLTSTYTNLNPALHKSVASVPAFSSPTSSGTVGALPAGVDVVKTALSTQDGNEFIYVLGTDARVYESVLNSSTTAFTPWQVLNGSGITTLTASKLSGGAVYSDGTTVYASYGGAFAALPAGITVADIQFSSDDNTMGLYVLGSDGVVYRYVSAPDRWVAVSDAAFGRVTAMSSSENDGGLVFTTGSTISFWSTESSRTDALPTASTAPVVRVVTASTGSRKTIYALDSAANLYKGDLTVASESATAGSFSGWTKLNGSRITQVGAQENGGAGAVYTDGSTVYDATGTALPGVPGDEQVWQVAVSTHSDGQTYTYALGKSGYTYRLASGASSWTKLPLPRAGVLEISEVDGSTLVSDPFTPLLRSVTVPR